jgi:hypothetical protein
LVLAALAETPGLQGLLPFCTLRSNTKVFSTPSLPMFLSFFVTRRRISPTLCTVFIHHHMLDLVSVHSQRLLPT